MAVNKLVIETPPEAVFAVLADPAAYGAFVVGSKHVRRFEPDFPELGSCFHHTLGVGPFILRDKTCVEEVEEGRRLVLLAHMRPFAVNRVAFTLRPVDEGTEAPTTRCELQRCQTQRCQLQRCQIQRWRCRSTRSRVRWVRCGIRRWTRPWDCAIRRCCAG